MTVVRLRPMPPAGAMLLLMAAVVALAAHLAAAPHAPSGEQIPGLTYEAERATPHAPLALVVTSVQDGSAAAKADIAAGDVIDGIDGRPIASVSSVARAVRGDAHKGVLLHIRHAGESRYKHLPAHHTQEPHVAENTRRRG
ncbi:MAG: PDZ domain-containing protein [Sphingopyxis sp.]|uniref:PDZ domain-containing protein n=1 Tax=Sphingopyxis sp. TaxID=1908224 RepID=UPI001A644538|nr:PDZ domain-containing protein [Sphingopyxis sp.]MBL9070738.1 PDZ domain-containing protein [Sphingopyxis sp.]